MFAAFDQPGDRAGRSSRPVPERSAHRRRPEPGILVEVQSPRWAETADRKSTIARVLSSKPFGELLPGDIVGRWSKHRRQPARRPRYHHHAAPIGGGNWGFNIEGRIIVSISCRQRAPRVRRDIRTLRETHNQLADRGCTSLETPRSRWDLGCSRRQTTANCSSSCRPRRRPAPLVFHDQGDWGV